MGTGVSYSVSDRSPSLNSVQIHLMRNSYHSGSFIIKGEGGQIFELTLRMQYFLEICTE